MDNREEGKGHYKIQFNCKFCGLPLNDWEEAIPYISQDECEALHKFTPDNSQEERISMNSDLTKEAKLLNLKISYKTYFEDKVDSVQAWEAWYESLEENKIEAYKEAVAADLIVEESRKKFYLASEIWERHKQNLEK